MSAQNITANQAFATLEEQLQAPLLGDQPGLKPQKPPGQKAIRKTFKGTAHLANLLPTGSVLAFRILSPALTHEGRCQSIISKSLTLGLLGLCGISCFVLCFTDSIRDERGKVRYGMATFRGLWIIDGSITVSPEDAPKYRIKFIDFFHAFMSVLVFGAVAMFDQNVINCFYPSRSEEAQEFLTALPVFVGIVCSIIFVVFPSKRHGIGFPLSRA
ncbi:protein DMP7-like [Coffea arabica]|uniref:Protein DMP7-like n=1 Tax=Coffea arabica TaxID=13443 RepID=A0ABM4UG17_COFAR